MTLMKKIYLSLLGAMTALTVAAQQQPLRSYSSYTVDPVTNEKTGQWDHIYENGKLTEEHTIYYQAEGNVEYKTLYYYDDQGRLLRQEDYEMRDGEYVMTYKREDTEYNENGFIAISTEYTEDENNPGQLVPEWKLFVYRYNDISAIDYEFYYPDGAGGWTYYGTVKPEFDSKGRVVKLIQEIPWKGDVVTSTKIWEYDDHDWYTKITYTSNYWDDYEYTYENFYDANGVIEKRNSYKDGQFEDTYYFVWGDPTAVQGVKAADVTAPWYDLSGHRLSTPPTKGIYIHKGRKIVMK
jgi:hypothetical protein